MTNQYILARIANRDAHLRASDADRERVAGRLRQGNAEGRLDLTEFQQRLERCYEAKTYGELTELVRDLPRQDEPDAARWWHPGRMTAWSLAPLAPILIALLVISASIGHRHVTWLWVPALFVVWRLSRRRRRQRWAQRGPGDLI